jgi:hypothetical protein
MVEPYHNVVTVEGYYDKQPADIMIIYLGIHEEENDCQPEQ